MKSFSKIKRKQRQFPRFNLLLRHQLLTLSFGVSKFVERIVNLIHMCSAHSWYIYAIVKRKHQHQHQHNHNPNKNTNQPCKCIHAHFHKSHFTTPDYTADVTSDVMWIATKMLTNIEPSMVRCESICLSFGVNKVTIFELSGNCRKNSL